MESSERRKKLLQEILDEVHFDFVVSFNLPPGQERDWDLVNVNLTTTQMRTLSDLMLRMDPKNEILIEIYPEQGQGFLGWTLDEALANDYYDLTQLMEIKGQKTPSPGDWAAQIVSDLERDSQLTRENLRREIDLVVLQDEPEEWRFKVTLALMEVLNSMK